MIEEDTILGRCPVCKSALIKNRRDDRKNYFVTLEGEHIPERAHYPDFYQEIDAVWCPVCGLTKCVSFPRMGLFSINPEYQESVERAKSER